MEISERAKQFGAFAAVKGFEKELRKREEIFEKKAILSDEKNAELDFMLREISVGDEIVVTHYLKNRYVKTAGVLKSIDKRAKSLSLDIPAGGEGLSGTPSDAGFSGRIFFDGRCGNDGVLNRGLFDDEMSISFSDIKDIEKR